MSVGFSELFRRATGFDPYPYQVALAEAPALPLLVRAPTGSGKTAAAFLAWLYRRRFHEDPEVRATTPRRLLYCLPLRTLVEQTADMVARWLQALGIADAVRIYVLRGGEVDRDWANDPTADAVLVGTMDMLLSRALNRGFAAARYRWPIDFGLVNNDSLWILDEVQLMSNGAVTSAQLQGLREAFGTYGASSSIWMSATVAPTWIEGPDFSAPTADRILELGPDDWSHPDLGRRLHARKAVRRLDLGSSRNWARELAAAVRECHRPGTRTLVVMNTVERAVQLHRELRRQRDPELVLVHARFRPEDRRRKVAALSAEPGEAGMIVTATQVVEAGVDLSSATLFTELAPWGSVVQRLGRCNRFGEFDEAAVYWLDGIAASFEPYDEEPCVEARRLLLELEGQSAGPADLEHLPRGEPPSAAHVLRRADLLDLFDTEPDLSGNDVDVSRFIRDDADVDCHVFWRRLDEQVPRADIAGPSPDELCPVPVARLRELVERLEGRSLFAWDHLARGWRPMGRGDVRPGMLALVAADAGGYDPDWGFDPRVTSPVDPIPREPEASAPVAFDNEEANEADGGWVTLDVHAKETAAVAARYARSLLADAAAPSWLPAAVEAAARWHDLGKVHPVFQRAVLVGLPEEERRQREGTVWAKSGHGALRYERRHFRHELAGALLLIELVRQQGPAAVGLPEGADDLALDLVVYLVAAHHGKVRLALRSLPDEHPMASGSDGPAVTIRGVQHGEILPSVTVGGFQLPPIPLDLSISEVGLSDDGQPSWLERSLRLRDRFGPFRLSFLEALVRLADWEASAGGPRSEGELHA